MMGSLREFIPLEDEGFLNLKEDADPSELAAHLSRRRGKSAFQTYQPDDKTNLLVRYEKNNLFQINRRKLNSIAREAGTKQQIRKPLVQHHSFFVKPEITKDYIAKQELKRKHNLLRAIMRMKQNEEQPNKESDYEQSFQRLYSGFKNIQPKNVLSKKEERAEEGAIPPPNKIIMEASKLRSPLGHRKRIEYENCLSWAKRHNKVGDFFAEQLGKNQGQLGSQETVINRSLIDDISKKVNLNWLS